MAKSMAVFLLGTMICCNSLALERGVTDSTVKLGRILPISDSQSQKSALSLKAGSDIFIKNVNKSGGVLGRKIEVITMDDKYDAREANAAAIKLIDDEKVFAIFETFGASRIQAIIPLIKKANLMVFGPYTGLASIRTPVVPQIFNVRASFLDEATALVKHAHDKLGINEFGVFVQDDAYGENGMAGVAKNLNNYGLHIITKTKQTVGKINVDAAVEELLKTKPKAVVCFSVGKAVANLITKTREKGYDPIFLLSSSLALPDVYEALKPADEAYIALLQPLPSQEKDYRIVQEFKEAAQKDPHPEMVSFSFGLQGYIDAAIFVEGLKAAGKNLTTLSLTKALESFKNHDIGGIKFSYSIDDHQALEQVYLGKITKGKLGLAD